MSHKNPNATRPISLIALGFDGWLNHFAVDIGIDELLSSLD